MKSDDYVISSKNGKPACPLCGGDYLLEARETPTRRTYYTIECSVCMLKIERPFDGEEEALKYWSQRPIEDAFINRNIEQAKEIITLRARIAELEAAERWIPVKERLPELTTDTESSTEHKSSETVLVDWFGCDNNENSSFFGEEWRDVEKAFIVDDVWIKLDDGSEIRIDAPEAPTHWMPLPALPKPTLPVQLAKMK